MNKQYKKINFYNKNNGRYICSTTWYKTCKAALTEYIKKYQLKPNTIIASYK